jgi:His/Glu/Gln/Arg/opine family amino acid ABC transporter permease subunit
VVTLEIAFGSWLVAVVLGLALAASRDLGHWAVRIPLVVLVTVLRSVPQLIVLYILFFGLPAVGVQIGSLTAAILGLGVTEAAFTAEYYRAGFMTVPETQRDAGSSLGMSRFAIMRLVVVPQAVPYVVAPLLNTFVSLLKIATLAAAVGAPEILYQAQQIYNINGEIVGVMALVIVIYIVVTIPLTRGVALLDKRIRSHAGIQEA